MFNQGPHQIDLIRVIGGGMLRSVRAMTGNWDPERSTEGAYTAFLQFADGAAATMAYSGYDHFDSDELHYWIATYGDPSEPSHGSARRELRAAMIKDEAALKASRGYGGTQPRQSAGVRPIAPHQIHWGITIVSCERGDLRQSPDGIYIYDDNGKREVPIPRGAVADVVDELYEAVVTGRPPLRDGRWEKATLEVCLAVLQSGRERREIDLSHQVPLNE
jgi:phthalate 4,5-cis-dihydrodiol dehydrogenase